LEVNALCCNLFLANDRPDLRRVVGHRAHANTGVHFGPRIAITLPEERH